MSVLTLHVSCSTSGVRAERRFEKGSTIATIKVGRAGLCVCVCLCVSDVCVCLMMCVFE